MDVFQFYDHSWKRRNTETPSMEGGAGARQTKDTEKVVIKLK